MRSPVPPPPYGGGLDREAPVTTMRAPETSCVRSPVPPPPYGGGLDREAELAAMKEKLEALQLAEETRQAKLEALELAEQRRQAEFEALQSDNRRLLGEVCRPLNVVD